ncbi:MAG: hypothetical protein HWE22_03020 [Flavobacteriales bacterium]|nr:hypothetical protein [Flavobacteriales bacterium]
MKTLEKQSLAAYIEPALTYVEDPKLKSALLNALSNKEAELALIEDTFEKIGSTKWTEDSFKMIFNAWKETHLKMLAIYGLSCRMQRIAIESEDPSIQKNELLMAAAMNAETSYEDLGLDFDGETHTQLYHDLAESFVSDDSWMLSKYATKEASAFKKYVYRNMVVAEDIQTGLFTNMFSEIYNHAEYSIALVAFNRLIDDHFSFTPEQKQKATTYIFAHIEDETELNHFTVVIDSLNHYVKGVNTEINYELAQETFETYLSKLSTVFNALSEKMF